MKKKKKESSLHVMKEESKTPEMSKEILQSLKQTPKVHPLLAKMPKHLKDPGNYEKIQRALLETLASKHSHGEMAEWARCIPCQRKVEDHRNMMVGLGFDSPAHYRIWKKIHETIRTRVPLR